MTTHKMVNQSTEHQQTVNAALGVFAGILIGGLAGATTMLLIAPQTGKHTRAQIRRKSIELRNRTVDGVDDVVGSLSARARQLVHGVKKQSRRLAIKQLDHLEDAVEAGKTAIESA